MGGPKPGWVTAINLSDGPDLEALASAGCPRCGLSPAGCPGRPGFGLGVWGPAPPRAYAGLTFGTSKLMGAYRV